ncbi:MAG: octanoyltransferase [Nitrospirales bacterium]|nr:MAG: octanoyltransferase [Nitrospirales bacterium]
MNTKKQLGCFVNLSHVRYQEAWDFQQLRLQERVEDRCVDTLLLVEHEPVFTLGRTAQDEHWKRQGQSITGQGFGLYAIERGGSVTYHGPGQVVGYPIVRLRNFCQGPKAYVGLLQDVIVRVLADWNIRGQPKAKFPGVWVEGNGSVLEKIAAIGVRITRGVTMHGFALNVNVDLMPFDLITPCGIAGCHVTSMQHYLGEQVNMIKVRERLAYHFAEVFGLEWKERSNRLPT